MGISAFFRSHRPRLLAALALLAVAAVLGTPAAALPPPTQLTLTVRETAGIARTAEVVRSGVPLPRSWNVKDPGTLAVVDAAGQRVPAEFAVTARWNAGLADATAPVQWLLVAFPATVGPRASATYRVVAGGTAGPNPAPARPLAVARAGDQVTVDTGAAVFRLGGEAGALFDEVLRGDGTRLAGGGALSAVANGAALGHSTTRRVTIEHAGPLSAVVVVEGTYDMAPLGGGALSSRRRYVFTAGSPTALVRHAVTWEGNLACNGCRVTEEGEPNGLLLGQVRDRLAVELGGTPTVTAVGGFAAPPVVRAVPAGAAAWVRQKLRASRTSPLAFDVDVAGTTAAGTRADGGMLAASGSRGAVAVALARMHRYEPQALRLLADGSLAVDVVGDRAFLAHHQSAYATLAVAALPPGPARADLDRQVWGPLNRPLHAWPEAAWFAASGAVDEFPVGPLPAELAGYDTVVSSVLARTADKIDALGLSGLMTFGLFPRYWGKDGADGEIGCSGANDPTPGEAWDDTFWCATWTDYHNTAATLPLWAMRTGDVEWLDEMAFPAAQRTLHTQIMQCGPDDTWFYCAQAPAGYGGYRSDFNSSHAYFENLFLYYWLTGDRTVIDVLRPGGERMRRWICPSRGSTRIAQANGPDGPACAADSPGNPNAGVTGRIGSQWLAAFRFLGLASPDGSFLEDFRSGLARAVTRQYVEAWRDGTAYGFWTDVRLGGAGSYESDKTWTIGFYDMNNLDHLRRDTGDAPIGLPPVAPSRVLAAVARAIKDVEMTVAGDGTPAGACPEFLDFTWSGDRLAATLLAAAPLAGGRNLFSPEKSSFTALLVRAGQDGGDAALLAKGREVSLFSLAGAQGEGAPLGKLQGERLFRLHAAVGRLANGAMAEPPAELPGPPAPPSGLAAVPASGSAVGLSWLDNSADEDGFRVERLVGSAFQEVLAVGANVTATAVPGLTAGVAHTFRVRAVNAAGFSAYSNAATTSILAGAGGPAAPTEASATALSRTEVWLAWRDNSSDETEFRIEKATDGPFAEARTTSPNVTGVKLSGLRPGTTYLLRVRAGRNGALSAYTNVAVVTMPP